MEEIQCVFLTSGREWWKSNTGSPTQKHSSIECNLLEGVQEAFYVVCRLVLQDFYAAFHLRRKKTDCEWERSFKKQNKTDSQWRCFHVCAAVWECVCVSHVYLRGLVEGAVGMDVVIENDDSDHDPHAEQERVLAAETTRILPKTTDRRRVKGEEKKWGLKWGSTRTNYIFLGFLLSEYMWVWMSSVVSKSQGLLYCLTKGHMMLLGFLPLLCCVVKHEKVLQSEKAQSYFLPQKTVLLCLKHLVCSRAFASVT